jgi:methylated-DNA-protein-cysteine methyltransferase-like protein
MSKFKRAVIKIINAIPESKVVSYGQVAVYAGIPRAARQVGWILNRLESNFPEGSGQVPWWRVVNDQGRISIKGSKHTAIEQKNYLEAEGIKVRKDLTFDIEKYRFIPNKNFIRKVEADPFYLEMISKKLPYSKYF